MRKIALSLLAIAVLSAGCAQARELSAQEKKLISDVARQQLKDPDSAQFYWQDYRGGDIYCAHVNAKNSYGGYAGKGLLLAGLKKNKAEQVNFADVMIYSGADTEIFAPICVKAGYKP